jgi:signal transduction histidine kinase/DNA-binding response OmpR family regulator
MFFRTYLNLKEILPKWDKLSGVLIRARIVLYFLAFPYFIFTNDERFTDIALVVYTIVQYFVVLAALWPVVRKKYPKSYFIIAATLFFIVGLIVNGLYIAAGEGLNKPIAEWALVSEVLLLTFGLAYRMKELGEKEKMAVRLEEQSAAKARLYTNVTHEFRTPLTVIKGMASQLMSKFDLDRKKAYDLIVQNTDYLLDMVNRLLQLAKIESGGLQLQLAQADMIGYIHQLIDFFQPFARQKKITLRLLTELDSLVMDFDTDKMRQILTNLLSNALKFSSKKGAVSVWTGRQDDHLVIKIQDQGIGISKDEMPFIFDRFYQAGANKHQQSFGSGIGLALTKELVDLMNGQITVASEPGKGTVFTLSLPIQNEAGKADHAWARDRVASAAGPALWNSGKKEKEVVLVIEDNIHLLQYMQFLLEDEYDVEMAVNGQEGIEVAIDTIPDLIISDVLMPVKDGFEVLETLKSDTKTSHIPIVLLTALASVEDRIAGLEKGADAYLSKPFEEKELLAVLHNLLQQRNRWHEQFLRAGQNAAGTVAVMEDPFLKNAIEVLQQRLDDENFGVTQLQKALALSRTQLHRKLMALTSMNTTEFINHFRLQKARVLLSNRDFNISEVAFQVGYSDPSCFSRLFTKSFGISPSEFRDNVH